MAQLDKTFPTNDCSMCIESPKFIECSQASQHRDPDLYRSRQGRRGSRRVQGNPDQEAQIHQKRTNARVVPPVSSTARSRSPIKYNQNLSLNKAIHIYFSQAVPLITYIDPDNCLFLQGEKCTICVGVCKNKAIDLHQEGGEDRSRGRGDRSVSGL